jgi:hypothetical protein
MPVEVSFGMTGPVVIVSYLFAKKLSGAKNIKRIRIQTM